MCTMKTMHTLPLRRPEILILLQFLVVADMQYLLQTLVVDVIVVYTYAF